MYSLILKNEWNNSIEMTHNENRWQVTSVTGLNPPAAVISTSPVVTFDGSRFNSSRLDNRNIVISFVFNGNVEQNREMINNVVMPKRYIKVYYKNRSKDVYIEGYVESLEYDLFSNKVSGQISIICPNPYWMDRAYNEVLFTQVIDLFEFPFSLPDEGTAISELMDVPTNEVINGGNIESGVVIEIEAHRNIIQPKVMNLTTGQSMEIKIEMGAGDRIIISTSRGQKYIKWDCNCEESNIINKLVDGSQWITLNPGSNRFTYSSVYGVENMVVTVSHRNLYGGV